jgi:hypothetical protein
MSYKNKFGSTNIKSRRRNNLGISWDYKTNPKHKYPILLFTPDMENMDNHYHIELNKRQAKILHAWLTAFLKE